MEKLSKDEENNYMYLIREKNIRVKTKVNQKQMGLKNNANNRRLLEYM